MAGMKAARWRGLYPIVQTPFTEAGEVDFDSLRRLVKHVARRAEGMTFPGFASEFWRLTEAEILACAEVIAREAEQAAVILNVTAQATAPAVRRAREFAALGAAGLMVLPPYTVSASPEGVEQHLEAVLEATDLAVIVQDSAGLTGTNLDPQALARLKAKHANLSGVKVDQVPTGPSITRYRRVAELADLSYVVGYSGVQMLDAVRRGAEALMGGCGHLELDRVMLEALLKGGGVEEFRRLAPLLSFEMQTIELVIAVHKRLLWKAGVIRTPLCRQPCREMDEFQVEELEMQMAAVRG